METRTQLKDLVLKDSYLMKYLSLDEVNELFSYEYVFENVDKIYKKVGVK